MRHGRATGTIDHIGATRIAGWALIEGHADPVEVDVWVGEHLIARVTANQLRPGLRDGGHHPTGLVGFVVEMTQGEVIESDALVRARIVGAEHELALSPPLRKARRRQEREEARAQPLMIELPNLPIRPPRSGFRIFSTTLSALFLREVRNRYGAIRFGYFWAIAQPMLFVLIINEARYLLGSSRGDEIYGVSGIFFFMIGVMPFFMFQNGYSQAMGAIGSGKGLFSYREVRPFDVILARCTLEFLLMGTVLLLIMLGMYWIDFDIDMESPLRFLAVLGLLFVIAIGFGLTADVYITRNEEMRRVFSLIERPLFFISGVMFTVDVVPQKIREWIMWNPLLHAIDLARDALLSEYDSPCSFLYLSLWAFGLLLFGLASYQRQLHRLTS